MHIDVIKAYLKQAKDAERAWFNGYECAHDAEASIDYGLIWMHYKQLREMLERLVKMRGGCEHIFGWVAGEAACTKCGDPRPEGWTPPQPT